jgi:pimeloyl-ACP methyl ester carboxylesterase
MSTDEIARLDKIVADATADAEIFTTPCGDGTLVWRRWSPKGRVARPVILAHGGSGSWTHWFKTIPALKQHYEVWAVDLPGLGDSAMPNAPFTPESSGKALAEGIRRLIPAARRPHLTAFSFGAHVSTLALVELQDWVAGFTITGCAALGLPQGPGIPFPKERADMSPAEALGVHRRLLEILMFHDPARIDPLAIHLQAGNVRRARFRSRPFARTPQIAENLPSIRVPVSALWGGNDQTAWPTIEARYDVLRSGHPELITRTVPDAGHWVMYEQAEGYAAALLELIATTEA